ERPQLGSFSEHVPRLTRAVGLGLLLCAALAFAIRTENPPFSRVVVGMSLGTVWLLVMLERGLLFRLEIAAARRQSARLPVLLLGTDDMMARLGRALERDPRQRARVFGWLRASPDSPVSPLIRPDQVRGDRSDLERLLDSGEIGLVIAGPGALPEDQLVDVLVLCQRRLVDFQTVPGLFRVLTSRVEMRTVDGIPLLGLERWPLDFFWNRFWKRAEDLIGSLTGLIIASPVILVAAALIRRESPGPAFFRQERCGRDGRAFTLIKLRTMRPDAEADSGPVWTAPDDPRRTRVGAVLRAWNIDELPQLWNVLRGEMSLVGPRPERPHFVAQFRDDLDRYMMRHVSKPGLTGWAQVNGLRGQTDLSERLKYDLWYLENWSLALDFKILARTWSATKNAY
ncbi:MAG: sugar transferase, partial [Kiritimatiellae bacterium]|nr:sugar transferase [Kiritimatiellia bacterium]